MAVMICMPHIFIFWWISAHKIFKIMHRKSAQMHQQIPNREIHNTYTSIIYCSNYLKYANNTYALSFYSPQSSVIVNICQQRNSAFRRWYVTGAYSHSIMYVMHCHINHDGLIQGASSSSVVTKISCLWNWNQTKLSAKESCQWKLSNLRCHQTGTIVRKMSLNFAIYYTVYRPYIHMAHILCKTSCAKTENFCNSVTC